MRSLTRVTKSESEGVADISTGAAEFVLRGLDEETGADVAGELGRPDDVDFPSPSELAALVGDDPGLGKTLMTGSTWHGVKLLG
jgi:hypothetical protein